MKGRTDTSGGRLGFAVSDLVPKSTGCRKVQELKRLAVGIQQQLRELWSKKRREKDAQNICVKSPVHYKLDKTVLMLDWVPKCRPRTIVHN